MIAPFMPMLFRSEEGEILFNGTPISEEAARVVRDVLRTAALDLSKTQEAADVFWTLCGQVRAAVNDAGPHRIDAADAFKASNLVRLPLANPTNPQPPKSAA